MYLCNRALGYGLLILVWYEQKLRTRLAKLGDFALIDGLSLCWLGFFYGWD